MNRLAYAIAACLLALAVPARAATFVVGVENVDYLPQSAIVNGELTGFNRALLDAYAKDRGHVFQYRPLPVSRLFRELVGGFIDFKYPDNEYWQKETKAGATVVYSAPVVTYIDGVIVLPKNVGHGAEAIHTLGTLAGFTPWEWLDSIKTKKVALVENPGFQGLIYQTVHERVDGAYVGLAEANYQLEQVLKTPGALVFDPALSYSRSFYALSTIKHPEIIADFNAWMTEKAAFVAALKLEYGAEKGVK